MQKQQVQNELSTDNIDMFFKKYEKIVIKISASWCGPCKNPNFLDNYYNLKKKFSQNQKIYFIELDIDKNQNIINHLNLDIDAVPTFIIYVNKIISEKYEGTKCLENIEKCLI